MDQVQLRNRRDQTEVRKLTKNDLRFKGVRVNSNEFFEFSERDEYLELHMLQLFTFQLRLDLSICSEKQEKTIQNHDIKEIVGPHHMESLRAHISVAKEMILQADTKQYNGKQYTDINWEHCAFQELSVMSHELTHFCHAEYCQMIDGDGGTDDKWQRDFGAPVIDNIIQRCRFLPISIKSDKALPRCEIVQRSGKIPIYDRY